MKKDKKISSKGMLIALGIFLLTKMKSLVVLLKFLKMHTLISMFISLGAYAIFYGWSFAAGLVYLIFVHEMGHLVAAKIKKIPTSPAVFIPFMGAVIGIDPKKIKDAKTEAFIAYGGPLFGLMSIIPLLIMYFITDNPFWALLTQVGGMINLFNLMPISPLDGGRIVTVLSTKFWFLGLLMISIYGYFTKSPIMILILLLGTLTLWGRLRDDFKAKKIQLEMGIIYENVNKIKELLKEFTQVNEDGDIYYSSHSSPYTSPKLVDLLNKVTEFEQKKLRFKKRYVSFIQDKQKLEKIQNEWKWLHTSKIVNTLQLSDSFLIVNQLLSLQSENLGKIERLEMELKRMKVYYQSSLRTKAITLTLYLVLALLLALAVIFGSEVMVQHSELIKR